MSVFAVARPLRRGTFRVGRAGSWGLAVCALGAALGWTLIGPLTLLVAGLAAAVLVPLAAGAALRFGAFVITLVGAAMLPLPTVTVGSVQFPYATLAVPVLLIGAVVVTRQRGQPVRIPHLTPYTLLLGVAVISVVCSYLFWDPRVATGAERGYGHRWIGYQLTGLYFLAVPLMAFAGGVLTSRLMRVERLYAAVFAVTLGLSLALLFSWVQHPLSPLDAFSQGARTKTDNQWAAYLLVLSTALFLYASRTLLRLLALLLLGVGLLATGVSYVLSGWFGVLAAVTVIIWHRYRSRGLVVWLVVLIVAGIAAQTVVEAIVMQRSSSPDVDRLKLWQSALTVWGRSPIIGVGPGNLASYMEAFNAFPLGLVLQGYQEPHNIFLEILAENGAVGFLLLAIFLGAVIRRLGRARGASATDSFGIAAALGLLFVAGGIGAFGGGFVPTIASAGYNALSTIFVVWVLIGCGAGLAHRSLRSEQRERQWALAHAGGA